jgi:L-threonylcarbamoyladenylate synthase
MHVAKINPHPLKGSIDLKNYFLLLNMFLCMTMQTEVGADIHKAVEFLIKGELVAVPTETVYGLAANALDEKAVLKIYHAKNRPKFNPLILHVPYFNSIKDFVKEIPDDCTKLATEFSPGPITYLLEKNDSVPDLVTAGSKRVALRVPNHPLLTQLLNKLDFPLAAPSANPSGYVSPVTAQHVLEGLNGKIPYILDGGECKVGLESTIVGFENGKTVIHRLGGITKEAIEKVLGKTVELSLSHSTPDTPGQLKSHYATATPLYFGNAEDLISRFSDKKFVVISLNKQFSSLAPAFQFRLSSSGNMDQAARRLFKSLRKADAMNVDLIIADRLPEQGLGAAINDRLQRAQHENKIS